MASKNEKTRKNVNKSKKNKDYTYETGKRKEAVARAKVEHGNGRILINSKPLRLWGSEMLRLWIKEPLELAGDFSKKIDIDINVKGGGKIAQTEAARIAISRGIVELSGDEKMKQKFMDYDRNLLVFDPRRNEPHKPSRSRKGARRHKQRSKR